MRASLLLGFCAALCLPATALAWSPLRAENPNVKKGNALMAEEQYPDALGAYDQAARELPDAKAVQLNRGLALLAQDLTDPAKEAFTSAGDPSAPPEVRADAYYDLGIAHARQGNARSEEERFDEASALFREAAEAFKRSLRIRPGNRNAAWNLEYALQRIREGERKEEQRQEEEQEQEEEPIDDHGLNATGAGLVQGVGDGAREARLEGMTLAVRPSWLSLFKGDVFPLHAQGRLEDRDGRRVEFSILTAASSSQRRRMATIIQQDLAELGILVR